MCGSVHLMNIKENASHNNTMTEKYSRGEGKQWVILWVFESMKYLGDISIGKKHSNGKDKREPEKRGEAYKWKSGNYCRVPPPAFICSFTFLQLQLPTINWGPLADDSPEIWSEGQH